MENKELDEELKINAQEPEEKAEASTEEPSETDRLLAKICELNALIKEKDDAHLRMAAEYENFRRRSREERESVYAGAVADTVGELLPIIDNLERAANYDDGEKVKEGLQLTLKTVSGVFAKLGVEAVGEVGDTFDPALHNAIMHVEDDEHGEGEITAVHQKGYRKGERILRYAMVTVAN